MKKTPYFISICASLFLAYGIALNQEKTLEQYYRTHERYIDDPTPCYNRNLLRDLPHVNKQHTEIKLSPLYVLIYPPPSWKQSLYPEQQTEVSKIFWYWFSSLFFVFLGFSVWLFNKRTPNKRTPHDL